jgi:hypothetical protein
MRKNIIRIDGDDFIGWCCSVCTWEMTAPRLNSVAGTMALNRLAQQKFDKHNCASTTLG